MSLTMVKNTIFINNEARNLISQQLILGVNYE
nr:MAG TPA: hypothetical protein [Inoviridae sp.]